MPRGPKGEKRPADRQPAKLAGDRLEALSRGAGMVGHGVAFDPRTAAHPAGFFQRLPPRSLLFGVPRPGRCRRDRVMKTLLSFGALVLAISTTTISAQAKDCLKGGSAGSVRGAIGGCDAGHYIAKHRQQDEEKEPPAGGGPVPALPRGQNPAPADSSTVTADA